MKVALSYTMWVVAVVLGLSVGGCGRADGPARQSVVVSVPPLRELVERLAPDADVYVLIKPGMSCHGYELTPEDVSKLARADVVVRVGAGLDDNVARALSRRPAGSQRVVVFADVVGVVDSHEGHHHAPGETCDHAVDPHLWVDPGLVERLVPALAEALGAPERGVLVNQAIRGLDAEISAVLAPVKGRTIVTHHAAFQRLADRYGLKVAAVIRPIPTEEPTPAEIAEAARAIKEQGAAAVFVEPQYNAAAAQRVAEAAGARLGRLDAMGKGEWFGLLRANAEEIARTLAGPEGGAP